MGRDAFRGFKVTNSRQSLAGDLAICDLTLCVGLKSESRRRAFELRGACRSGSKGRDGAQREARLPQVTIGRRRPRSRSERRRASLLVSDRDRAGFQAGSSRGNRPPPPSEIGDGAQRASPYLRCSLRSLSKKGALLSALSSKSLTALSRCDPEACVGFHRASFSSDPTRSARHKWDGALFGGAHRFFSDAMSLGLPSVFKEPWYQK